MRSVNRNARVVATPVLGLHEFAAAELACVLLSLRGVRCNRDLAAGDDHWASWGARVDRALSHEYLSLLRLSLNRSLLNRNKILTKPRERQFARP